MTGPRRRALAWAALALLAADVLLVLVTPGASLLTPLGAPAVGLSGLALRLALAALLLCRLTVRRRALWLLLLPTLLHFHAVSGRLGGDGVMYYVQLRSLMADRDIDLTNEYRQMGLLERPELRLPLRSGLRRTVFSVGPALVGMPFYALGEGLARAGTALGVAVEGDGFGPLHVNTVALGGLLLGFAAIWVVESTLRRHFAAATARAAALLIWGATFLYWYMVQQPTMAHADSAFVAAVFILVWDRTREAPRRRDALALGLLAGLAMCVRWQNAVLLALPLWDLARGLRRDKGAVGRGALLAGGTLLAALPQMMVWHAIFGSWVLLAPPQGTDFVRLGRPFVLETLFSSRHGLFSWTPVLAAAVLGFVPLLRRRPSLAAPLLVPLAAITYVNMCSGDWWAGGSFGNRRFDSLLPVLAFGLAAAWDTARRHLRRRPGLAIALLVAGAVAWNAAVVDARVHGTIPTDDTCALADAVEAAAGAAARHVGSPQSWPASWAFAARYDLPPDRFDTLSGRYLFLRQNNQRGCIEPGQPAFADQLEGTWSSVDTSEGEAGLLRGPGQVWIGLDLPEDLGLRLRVRAAAPAALALAVNGTAVALLPLGTEWSTVGAGVPRALWRRDLNAVTLRAPGALWLRALRFDRRQGETSAACTMEQP